MRINKNFLILLAAMLFVSSLSSAQAGKVPPFRILKPDGKVFKAQDLPMGKPIILIYFLPDCDHCQKLTKVLTKRITEFKKASIAMITYQPLNQVSRFVNDYNLKKYPNFYVGTEGSSLFVRNYYNIMQMPFVALYTKNGDLIKLYPKDEGLNDLSLRLKKL
ncbi:MAG: thiol-disulfide oxidoreductase [Segetibacter sp.]|nr:thiol-disulfide oxidoreductase [Segetibacter sp.]